MREVIVVLSVEHTGTHFLCGFLEYLGKGYKQLHTLDPEVATYIGGKAVIPLRDPLLQFMSYRKRGAVQPFGHLLQACVDRWEDLERLIPKFDVEFLRIDTGMFEVDKEKRIAERTWELQRIANHIEAARDPWGYGWPACNVYKDHPTFYDEFNSVSEGERKIILDALQAPRDRFGYSGWWAHGH